MFRRLAREAVIFMLLGMALTAVGCFVYMHHSDAASIQGQRDALKKNCDLLARGPAGATVIERDGIALVTVDECISVFGSDPKSGGYIDLSAGLKPKKSAPLDLSEFGGKVVPNPQPDSLLLPDTVQAALVEGTRIKNLKVDNAANALTAALVGLYGFVGGFGVWLFYRLVRFAVKG